MDEFDRSPEDISFDLNAEEFSLESILDEYKDFQTEKPAPRPRPAYRSRPVTAEMIEEAEAADAAKERFYDTLNEEKLRTTQKIRDYHETISLYMRMLAYDGMVSLTELARQYSDESPGYVIQSWMRSRNTLEFPPVGIGSECRIR